MILLLFSNILNLNLYNFDFKVEYIIFGYLIFDILFITFYLSNITYDNCSSYDE